MEILCKSYGNKVSPSGGDLEGASQAQALCDSPLETGGGVCPSLSNLGVSASWRTGYPLILHRALATGRYPLLSLTRTIYRL
jgi:hypothetical protein